jgi:DNA-binding response OmpR family regulator
MVKRVGMLSAEEAFIQKPYTMTALLAKIRAVLDQGNAANGKPKADESFAVSVN